jgi:hypothetical protein
MTIIIILDFITSIYEYTRPLEPVKNPEAKFNLDSRVDDIRGPSERRMEVLVVL